MTFIASVFLTIVVFVLVAFVYAAIKAWEIQRRWRRMAADFAKGFGKPGTDKHDSRQPKPQQQSKIIGREVGEYVDFEELTVAQTVTGPDGTQRTTVKTEQQITDIEWEDI